jgi:hypothetical protein
MKSQGNLKFQQNKCHPGDVRDTRRQFAKATDHKFESVWIETSLTCVYTRRERPIGSPPRRSSAKDLPESFGVR